MSSADEDEDIFHVPLCIDGTEIVINCQASDVAQVSKMKRKQDIHFIEYMSAFYVKVMAAGLVKDGFCTLDSTEVLQNVQRLREEEEVEKLKRSAAADGLVSMHSTVPPAKRASTSHSFHPPTKKGKGVGKTSKKVMKKNGPNLTGIPMDSASDADHDAILIESGMEPGTSTAGLKPPHMWSEEETATLWSYVEKFQLQLFHGKDNMTRPQVIAKITALLNTHLDLNVQRKQVDDKVYHIERQFRSRETARYSGAADQSYWLLEERVIAVCGTRPSITPETISSFGPSKDNTTKPDDQSPTASQQDAVIPSSAKKLTSKMNQSDKVLTYLKASDAAAKEMHDENKVMKKQLIGLLAKIVGASREELDDMGTA